jgi:hypothetical protein
LATNSSGCLKGILEYYTPNVNQQEERGGCLKGLTEYWDSKEANYFKEVV